MAAAAAPMTVAAMRPGATEVSSLFDAGLLSCGYAFCIHELSSMIVEVKLTRGV